MSRLRLMSLWEIMKFYDITDLVSLLRHIQDMRRLAAKMCELDGGNRSLNEPEFEKLKASTGSLLILAQYQARKLQWQSTWERVREGGYPNFWLTVQVDITWQRLLHELDVLLQCIEADAGKSAFVFIHPDAARLVLGIGEGGEWQPVFAAMPTEVKAEVEHALDSYMVELHTASVFYSMRVAEYGLRYLATKIRATGAIKHNGKRQPIELADWNQIITAINNKIAAIRKRARVSLAMNEKLQLYSDAADHCGWMKDIWRNNASHLRKPYKKSQALNVIERVRDFMVFVSGNFNGL